MSTIPPNAVRSYPPSWLSPGLVVALAPWDKQTIVVPPSSPLLILPPNPNRIAVAFFALRTDATPAFVSPFADASLYNIPIPSTTGYLLIGIDDHYSLVGGQWYAYSDGGATVRVVEFKRPT